jgi:hypothetical protein
MFEGEKYEHGHQHNFSRHGDRRHRTAARSGLRRQDDGRRNDELVEVAGRFRRLIFTPIALSPEIFLAKTRVNSLYRYVHKPGYGFFIIIPTVLTGHMGDSSFRPPAEYGATYVSGRT